MRQSIKDIAIRNACKLRQYAAVEPSAPAYQSSSSKEKAVIEPKAAESQSPLQQKPVVELKQADSQPASGEKSSVTAKDQDKQQAQEQTQEEAQEQSKQQVQQPAKQPVYHLASAEQADGLESPTAVTVTPLIRDIINKVRPRQITGTIKVEGREYEFGSGGRGQSIPYGDYLITPDSVGSWGSRHGAIGVANGTIADPKLHRDRDGIELHAATNEKLETSGCVSIRKDQWPEFRKQVLAMLKQGKKVYLHVSDQGASVSTNPLGFIGGTISEPAFRAVLSELERPVRKTRE